MLSKNCVSDILRYHGVHWNSLALKRKFNLNQRLGSSVPANGLYSSCFKDRQRGNKWMQKGTSARNLVKRSAEFLVTLLFMRIEFVDNNSKALETRLENRIQRIDDDLKTNIERIVKKRLQIYETASTTRRKERRDIIFNKSLLIRTSVLLAFFNNQHHSASQHKMIFSSVFLSILPTEYSLCSTAVDCEIGQSENLS